MSQLSKSDVADKIEWEGWPDVLETISSEDIEDQALAILWREASETMANLNLNYDLITHFIEDEDCCE